MKKTYILATLTVALFIALWGCNSDSKIGMSIVQDKIEVIVDSSFTVSGRSLAMEKVQSRTVAQLLGRIEAPGFGKLSSNVVTQFMPSSILDTLLTTSDNIDSLIMYMYISNGEFVGDSIVPMGMNIYRLTKNLPSPIYSNFDPEGYYDGSKPLASKIYNVSSNSIALTRDTVFDEGVRLSIRMPNELAVELFDAYQADRNNFTSPSAFVDNVFKGVYIENSFGSGRLIRTSTTMMTLFYHYFEEDSLISSSGNYFAVTPEIITNNDIDYQMSDDLKSRANSGETLVVAPLGYEVEMRFPAPEVIASYKKADKSITVLNTLTFSVPASSIANDFDITLPTYMLLVLTKDKDQFFADNKLPDNVTSFYAAYDSSSGEYNFGDMRAYLRDLLEKDNVTEEDYTFSLIPVSALFESSSSSSSYYYYGTTTQTLSMIIPYTNAPCMAQIHLDRAQIVLSYSTQTVE